MELKQATEILSAARTKLLIVPYGIETTVVIAHERAFLVF